MVVKVRLASGMTVGAWARTIGAESSGTQTSRIRSNTKLPRNLIKGRLRMRHGRGSRT
jgi:hypothetical protein